MMRDLCPLKRCEYANSPTGSCIWPGYWCPNLGQRESAERSIEYAQRRMAESRRKKQEQERRDRR
jgi:hypothetical protein